MSSNKNALAIVPPDDDKKQLPALRRSHESLTLAPVMDTALALVRQRELHEVYKNLMKPLVDYGVIPGTDKPTLLKPGAEKLCHIYALYPEYEFATIVEDWDRTPPLFDYNVKCTLRSRHDDSIVSTGMGSCNSYESRYKYRFGKRVCPDCGKDAIIQGKKEWGGGFICLKKAGGCGAKFGEREQKILSQPVGKVANEDLADQKNTVLKQGCKRSYIDATQKATGTSGMFNQDIGDIDVNDITDQDIAEAMAEDKAIRSGQQQQEVQDVEYKPVPQEAKPFHPPVQDESTEEKVPAPQMIKLTRDAKANGWEMKQIIDYVCQKYEWPQAQKNEWGNAITPARYSEVYEYLTKNKPAQ